MNTTRKTNLREKTFCLLPVKKTHKIIKYEVYLG